MNDEKRYFATDSPGKQMLAPEDKKRRLFLKQKELLDTFLAHGAISREQYDTGLKGLVEKMGTID